MSKSVAKDYAQRDYGLNYSISTIVTLIRKKPNGYPKFLDFGINYKVNHIENETIYLENPNDPGMLKKIHYSYILPISEIRNIALKKLLEND
jgi:hypothetical protein